MTAPTPQHGLHRALRVHPRISPWDPDVPRQDGKAGSRGAMTETPPRTRVPEDPRLPSRRPTPGVGVGDGDGGGRGIPLLQQWTMATPVNTLCSFPFSLQNTTGPSRRPCGVSETAPSLPPPGASPWSTRRPWPCGLRGNLPAASAQVQARGRSVPSEWGLGDGRAVSRDARTEHLGHAGRTRVLAALSGSFSGPFALLGADTRGC